MFMYEFYFNDMPDVKTTYCIDCEEEVNYKMSNQYGIRSFRFKRVQSDKKCARCFVNNLFRRLNNE